LFWEVDLTEKFHEGYASRKECRTSGHAGDNDQPRGVFDFLPFAVMVC
jgi:hypothetical protein